MPLPGQIASTRRSAFIPQYTPHLHFFHTAFKNKNQKINIALSVANSSTIFYIDNK